MTTSIWPDIIVALETDSRGVAARELKAVLDQETEIEPIAALLAEWAPLIGKLSDGEGKSAGLGVLRPHAVVSPPVVEVALAAANDAFPPSRQWVAQILSDVLDDDPRAQEVMRRFMTDNDQGVREFAISQLRPLLSAANKQKAPQQFYVIEDPAYREQALEVVSRIERAINYLEDSGALDELEEPHRIVVDDVVHPAIDSLKVLLSDPIAKRSEVKERAARSVFDVGKVSGALPGIAQATTILAQAPNAISNVTEAAVKVSSELMELKEPLEALFEIISNAV